MQSDSFSSSNFTCFFFCKKIEDMCLEFHYNEDECDFKLIFEFEKTLSEGNRREES